MKKEFIYFNIIILIIIIISYIVIPAKVVKQNYNYVLETSYITKVDVTFKEEMIEKMEGKELEVFYGTITSYVSYCEGCIGITASGYDVTNTIYYGTQDPVKLANCYRNSLELAREYDVHSIAFPAISTGVYGYPKAEACKVAVDTVKAWLEHHAGYEIEIIFSCFDDTTVSMYKNIL